MYNTRRTGGYGGRGGNVNSPASNVGQRRPIQNNFVPGGQLRPSTPAQTKGPGPNTPRPVQPPKTDSPQKLQKAAEGAIKEQKAAEVKVVIVPAPVVKQEAVKAPVAPVVEPPKELAPPPAPILSSAEEVPTDDVMDTSGDDTVKSAGPPWMKKNRGKITKAEKVKRRNQRNQRLGKILQPKNALMVLNEIAGATAYELCEMQPASSLYCGITPANFKATVVVDGQTHEGFGKNKPAAKTAAAEAALKHLVLTRVTANENASEEVKAEPTGEAGTDESNGEKMEVEEKEDISYCHLASFALYKLYSSWDDGGKIMSRSNSHSNLSMNEVPKLNANTKPPQELRPSKKMPEHPEQMNPVMLLNQMYPSAQYEEVCKTGIPPAITFTMKLTIDGKAFIGNGSNKKVARRDAAFQACKDLLGVQYPETEEM